MGIQVIKKDGTIEEWQPKKIEKAILLASHRAVGGEITTEEIETVIKVAEEALPIEGPVVVEEVHEHILKALRSVNLPVYASYYNYRHFRKEQAQSLAKVYEVSQKLIKEGDNENANKDSSINSTKSALIGASVMRELMMKYILEPEWRDAHESGNIHIHDLAERYLSQKNCCLFNMGQLLKDGFSLNGIQYSEPNGVYSALNIAGDVSLCASAQQLGGFSISEFDKVFAPYAEKTFNKAFEYFSGEGLPDMTAAHLAENQTMRDIEQGIQAFTVKLLTVSNSLGQTPFISISFGLDTSVWGRAISKEILKQRIEGIGVNKITAIFPKLQLLYRDEINGLPESPNYDIKQLGLKCNALRLYPDWLNMNNGYLGDMYEQSGDPISSMGCRAFLSEWRHPETNELTFNGRANIGAVSLNLVKFALDSKGNQEEFFKLIDKYAAIAFDIHEFTYKDIGKQKASTNPLFYCEGGAWKKLKPTDNISEIIDSFTASLGYVGMEEVCQVFFGKPMRECQQFAQTVVKYLRSLCDEAKEKYNHLYALYSSPAESLAGRFMAINKELYGEIENITDREYLTNSFHNHVKFGSEDGMIAPAKIVIESPYHEIASGGHISYIETVYGTDVAVLEQLVDLAMKQPSMYFGINTISSTCECCGHQGGFDDECPSCGSMDVYSVARICGYLSVKKSNGKDRWNNSKKSEIKDRTKHV